jgi:hypothetical protein
MPYILNVSQVPVTLERDFPTATIKDNANWVLSAMRDGVLKCMSLQEAMRRLWKKFQVRGIISKTEPYPLTPKQAQSITLNEFVPLATKAYQRSIETVGRDKLRQQKTEALREAFASVSAEDKRTLKDLLFLDFELFGFNADLPDVFMQDTGVNNHNHFSYFDIYLY